MKEIKQTNKMNIFYYIFNICKEFFEEIYPQSNAKHYQPNHYEHYYEHNYQHDDEYRDV